MYVKGNIHSGPIHFYVMGYKSMGMHAYIIAGTIIV